MINYTIKHYGPRRFSAKGTYIRPKVKIRKHQRTMLHSLMRNLFKRVQIINFYGKYHKIIKEMKVSHFQQATMSLSNILNSLTASLVKLTFDLMAPETFISN